MEDINKTVYNEMKEYAALYFAAIVEANTIEGECELHSGRYTAKELVNRAKCPMRQNYILPADEIFNEEIEISVGTFNCKFLYRDIFAIMAKWENISKPGKDKAVFEIGAVEEKTAKVLIDEKTELGAYKTKGTKMQRITGNWWMPRKLPKNNYVVLFYELNGVMFTPGLKFWYDEVLNNPQKVAERCVQYNDAKIIEMLTSFITNNTESPAHGYFVEVACRACVEIDNKRPDTPAETPQISTEIAETVNVSVEGEKEAERAENVPERKIKYFHYTPEQLKRYIIDVYEKYANGEWVLQPHKQIDTDAGLWDVVGGKIGYWTNWRREKFTEINMDFNSLTCGACYKINRTYQQDYFIVSNEKLLEFTIGGNYYYIQKQTYSKGKHRWCYTIMDAHGDFAVDDFSYTKRGIMQRFNKWWKKNATIIWQSSEFASQSPETPKTGCVTLAQKMRRRQIVEPRADVRRFRTSQRATYQCFLLVADEARRIAPTTPRGRTNILRHCAALHHLRGATRMILPQQHHLPPIRGDCKIGQPVRAKPPNFTKLLQTSYFKPP